MKIGLKILLSFYIAAFSCCNAYSQSYMNNWLFGDSAYISFESSPPLPFVSGMLAGEASASISDSVGNLLFYTNGENVWNKNGVIMPNGDSLHIGVVDDYGSSVTQGVIIIPYVGLTNSYYIFQLQRDEGIVNNFGLEYTIVNMDLADGLGDVTEKNIELYDKEITEKMQAVRHGNGRDWWLLVDKKPEFDGDDYTFIKFLITPDGIEGPFEQDAVSSEDYIGWGEMVFSKNGDKLAYTRGSLLDIYDFDRCSGELNNFIQISNLPDETHYGCSFSPNGNMVYVSDFGIGSILYQFCLNCDGIPVDSTRQLVFKDTIQKTSLGQHEIGPDNKIYIAMYAYGPSGETTFFDYNMNLCVINNPDEVYPLCNFDTNTISLGTRRTLINLPNMPNYNLGPLAGSECDTLGTAINNIMEENKITVYPNPVTDNLTLHSNNNSELHFEIKSIQGQIIESGNFIKQANINFKNYLPGIYLIEISDLNNKLIQADKIVKE